MPFNIPNAADAEDQTQAQPDSRDFSAMIAAAFAGTGVVSGCAVTAQGTPNMTVAVAAGSVAVTGTTVAVTGGNVTITTANATNPRFDLICVDNTGTKSAVAGTPAASPVFPDPAGKVVLAAVRVPAAASAINAAKIVDKRLAPVIPPPAADPTGAYKFTASSAPPTGYLLCDGSAVSRATYATLFSVISTQYGAGDGSTTFNLPDFQGRFPVGVGTHTDINAAGKNEGVATVANRRPRHNHTNGLTLPDHGHGVSDPTHGHQVNFDNGAGGGSIRTPTWGAGSTGVVTSNGVGTTSIVPASTGVTVGSVTSTPGVNGTIGPGGTNPVDSSGYLACYIHIKT
jgi:microcystin-dependent protein